MSKYIGAKATLVYGPIGRRKDGEWSKRLVIYAAFAKRKEADIYISLKRLNGVPVGLKRPYDTGETFRGVSDD